MQIELNIAEENELGLTDFDFKMLLGIALYEKGIVCSGLAAEIIGISRADFITQMDAYSKAVWKISEEVLTEKLNVARQFLR